MKTPTGTSDHSNERCSSFPLGVLLACVIVSVLVVPVIVSVLRDASAGMATAEAILGAAAAWLLYALIRHRHGLIAVVLVVACELVAAVLWLIGAGLAQSEGDSLYSSANAFHFLLFVGPIVFVPPLATIKGLVGRSGVPRKLK